MGRYRLKNSTFFTNCIGNRYSSPFLISLASLDSFPPGEAMALPRQCAKLQFVVMLTKADKHIINHRAAIP